MLVASRPTPIGSLVDSLVPRGRGGHRGPGVSIGEAPVTVCPIRSVGFRVQSVRQLLDFERLQNPGTGLPSYSVKRLGQEDTGLFARIRGHLTEDGWVAPRGTAHMTMLADLIDDEEMASTLPEAARPMFKLMIDLLAEFDKQVSVLDREIARRAKEDEAARRLMTIPGIGPIAATTIIALAPPIETFRKGATSRPGSASRRASTQPAASNG